MKRTLVLLSPLLVGFIATPVSGLVNYPLLVFDREPTRYFNFYGFPAQWYMVPTSQCEALIQQTQAYASCQGGFLLYGFLLNLAFYTLLSIPFVYVLTRIFRKSNAES